jgi:putative transposase
MLVYEFKLSGTEQQYRLIDEAIRTALFVRNSCIRYWMDNKKVGKYDLSAICKTLAREFSFANKLNSMARQASADRAWASISRFYEKRVSKKLRRAKKGEKVNQSNNYRKARNRLARRHLKVSRQRKDFAVKLARCGCQSNDLIAYEDLRVSNLVKNQKLAKSISDASWYQFRVWIEYFGRLFGRVTVAVAPQYTSQDCSNCGKRVQKTLSTRTHKCVHCGYEDCRDANAARNILKKAIGTVGHTGTWTLDDSLSHRDVQNAWGDLPSTDVDESQDRQGESQQPRIPGLLG